MLGERLRSFRKKRDLTAAQLAEQCTKLGLPLSRSKIANMENGRARQEGVSIAEVMVLAAALEVPPVLLILPIGTDRQVELLPKLGTDPWTAYQCFVGDRVLVRAKGSPGDPAQQELAGRFRHWYVPALPGPDDPIAAYRQHDTALAEWQSISSEEVFREIERATPGYTPRDSDAARAAVRAVLVESSCARLADARIRMHRNAWPLPSITADAAEAIRAPLLALGYRQGEDQELIALYNTASGPIGRVSDE